MTWLLPLLMFVILFVCMATMYSEGMWSNGVRLINVVTAGLLATNFFEPRPAGWTASWGPAAMHGTFSRCGFCSPSFWGLCGGHGHNFPREGAVPSYCRSNRQRLLRDLDQLGRGLFHDDDVAHRAAFRNFLRGGFQPEQRMLVFAPDRQWLAFVRKVSMGAFRRSATAEERQNQTYVSDPDADSKYAIFDENADFMPKYATRRSDLEKHVSQYDSILVSPKGGAPVPPPTPHK